MGLLSDFRVFSLKGFMLIMLIDYQIRIRCNNSSMPFHEFKSNHKEARKFKIQDAHQHPDCRGEIKLKVTPEINS